MRPLFVVLDSALNWVQERFRGTFYQLNVVLESTDTMVGSSRAAHLLVQGAPVGALFRVQRVHWTRFVDPACERASPLRL